MSENPVAGVGGRRGTRAGDRGDEELQEQPPGRLRARFPRSVVPNQGSASCGPDPGAWAEGRAACGCRCPLGASAASETRGAALEPRSSAGVRLRPQRRRAGSAGLKAVTITFTLPQLLSWFLFSPSK